MSLPRMLYTISSMVDVSDCVVPSLDQRAHMDLAEVEAVWPFLMALRDRSPSVVLRRSALASDTDVA